MSEILNILDKCEQRLNGTSGNPMTLDMLADIFSVFRQNYPQEYVSYNLAALAVQMMLPKVYRAHESSLSG